MSYMRPSYIHFSEFDTEHTRFASKYSLYLYREQGIDSGQVGFISPFSKKTGIRKLTSWQQVARNSGSLHPR